MTKPPARGLAPPGATTLNAAAAVVRRRVVEEWRAVPVALPKSKPPLLQGLGAAPGDLRPADAIAGRALLRGTFTLADATLEVGPGGDPWRPPSPSRRFAVQLHRFAWLPNLLARGEAGAAEALRLTLDGLALFAAPPSFAWSPEVLERRVFNLACASTTLAAAGDEADARRLAEYIARQTRALAESVGSPQREAERLTSAAVGATALAGKAGSQLLDVLLPRLAEALEAAVLPDGALRTRSPQQGVELLYDLHTLDDALLQRGREAPAPMSRAIERLSGAARFFTLADGALASFQGGESLDPDQVAAVLSRDTGEQRPYSYLPQSGYHRLSGRGLQVIVDAGAPAADGWSETACAQPLSIEVVADQDRLFANTGWSPDANGPPALRLASAANTASLGDGAPGELLSGWRATGLGARLVNGAQRVEARRNESEAGVWLETSHDGWVRALGLIHARRLFVDTETDELRGEDRFHPQTSRRSLGAAGEQTLSYALRFHVPPEVKVSLALDGRSVLLQGPSNRRWWFRNDATEVALEPSAHFRRGLPQRSVQVVLRGVATKAGETRVRWKLTPVEPAPPGPTRP